MPQDRAATAGGRSARRSRPAAPLVAAAGLGVAALLGGRQFPTPQLTAVGRRSHVVPSGPVRRS